MADNKKIKLSRIQDNHDGLIEVLTSTTLTYDEAKLRVKQLSNWIAEYDRRIKEIESMKSLAEDEKNGLEKLLAKII